MEEWKDIEGTNGQYLISSYGRAKSFIYVKRSRKYREVILKPSLSKCGYLRYGMKGRQISAHRLVALHFIPNPELKPEINHKDGNKTNNQISNLEWCTRTENEHHARTVIGKKYAKGEKHPASKISDETRNGIIQLYRDGLRMCEIAKRVGLHDDYVIKIVRKSGFYEKRVRPVTFTGERKKSYYKEYQKEWAKTHPGRARKFIPLELQLRENGRFKREISGRTTLRKAQ